MRVFIHNGSLELQSFVKVLVEELCRHSEVYVVGNSESSWRVREKLKRPWNSISLGNKRRLTSLFRSLVKSMFFRVFSTPSYLFYLTSDIRYAIKSRKNISEVILINYVNLYKPDIIHVQWATHLKLFHKIILNNDYPTKVVVSWRGRLINISPNIDSNIAEYYRNYFPFVDGFHAVSHAIRREGLKWVSTDNCNVIYTGLSRAVLQATKKIRHYNEGSLKIVSTGRFHWKKGYNIALIAIRRLLDLGYDVQYSIIARGFSEEIEFLIDSLELKRNVRVYRNLSQEEVYKTLIVNDLFLLPSIEEGIANSALEAMCLGLPVLSSDCGGMSEVIGDSINGLLFRNTDIDNLVEKVIEFNKFSDETKTKLSDNALTTINSHFGPERLGDEMITFYKSLLK